MVSDSDSILLLLLLLLLAERLSQAETSAETARYRLAEAEADIVMLRGRVHELSRGLSWTINTERELRGTPPGTPEQPHGPKSDQNGESFAHSMAEQSLLGDETTIMVKMEDVEDNCHGGNRSSSQDGSDDDDDDLQSSRSR